MRKGKLVIQEKKTFKAFDVCFDKVAKACVEILRVDGDNIWVRQKLTQNPGKVSADSLIELIVQDTVEDKKFFEIAPAQQHYLYKSAGRDQFHFITKDDLIRKKAIAYVLCKEVRMQGDINHIAPIANAYGMYVASQKAIGERAEKFEDWYFDVSI